MQRGRICAVLVAVGFVLLCSLAIFFTLRGNSSSDAGTSEPDAEASNATSNATSDVNVDINNDDGLEQNRTVDLMDVVMAVADEMQLMEDKKEEEGSKSDDDVDDDVPLHITLKVPVNLKNVLEEHLNKTFGEKHQHPLPADAFKDMMKAKPNLSAITHELSELDRILESPLYLGVLDDLRRIKTQLLVSSLDRVQLQKMVKDFKKSGPEVPAFVPDEGDILGGADPLNPLRGN